MLLYNVNPACLSLLLAFLLSSTSIQSDDSRSNDGNVSITISKNSVVTSCEDSIFILSFGNVDNGMAVLSKYVADNSTNRLVLIQKLPIRNLLANTPIVGDRGCNLYWAATTQGKNQGYIGDYAVTSRNAKIRKPTLYVLDIHTLTIKDSLFYSSSVSSNYSGSFNSRFLQPANRGLYLVDMSDGIKTDSTFSREINGLSITTKVTENLFIPLNTISKSDFRYNKIEFSVKEPQPNRGTISDANIFNALFARRADDVKVLYETENTLFVVFDKHMAAKDVEINNVVIATKSLIDDTTRANCKFLIALDKGSNNVIGVYPFVYNKGGKIIKEGNIESHINGFSMENVYVDSLMNVWYSLSSINSFTSEQAHEKKSGLFSVVIKFDSLLSHPVLFLIPYRQQQYVDIRRAAELFVNMDSKRAIESQHAFKSHFDYLSNDIISVQEIKEGIIVINDAGRHNILNILKR